MTSLVQENRDMDCRSRLKKAKSKKNKIQKSNTKRLLVSLFSNHAAHTHKSKPKTLLRPCPCAFAMQRRIKCSLIKGGTVVVAVAAGGQRREGRQRATIILGQKISPKKVVATAGGSSSSYYRWGEAEQTVS